jgi:hypothetical protein
MIPIIQISCPSEEDGSDWEFTVVHLNYGDPPASGVLTVANFSFILCEWRWLGCTGHDEDNDPAVSIEFSLN